MSKILPHAVAHDHDCFEVAARSADDMDGRVGHFLYVANDEKEDSHYRGNTAFAAGVFRRLAREVVIGHEFGKCAHCDAVAWALNEAYMTFTKHMETQHGSC